MATGDQDANSQGTGDAGGTGGTKDINLNLNISGGGKAGDSGDDDLTKADTAKFTDEQKNDYIEKLKDENARRRIAGKKLQKTLDDMTSQFDEMKKKVEELTTKEEEVKKKEKEASLAEKSEIEKLRVQMDDLQKSMETKEGELLKLRSETKTKDVELTKKTRENFVDRLVRSLGFSFSSDYERNGFISDLLKTNAKGELVMDDEEVVLEVNKLAKSRGTSDQTKDINVPGAGPLSKMGQTPLVAEIQTLLKKENLTLEERTRLVELTDEIEKRRSAAA